VTYGKAPVLELHPARHNETSITGNFRLQLTEMKISKPGTKGWTADSFQGFLNAVVLGLKPYHQVASCLVLTESLITTTAILPPLYRPTYVRRHLQLRTARISVEQSFTAHIPLLMATRHSDYGENDRDLLNGVTYSLLLLTE